MKTLDSGTIFNLLHMKRKESPGTGSCINYLHPSVVFDEAKELEFISLRAVMMHSGSLLYGASLHELVLSIIF